MGIDQRCAGKGCRLNGDPHHHDMIGKGYHGHRGQKEQHGACKNALCMDVGCLEIGDGVNGYQKEEQGNHQKGKQAFGRYRKIFRKQWRQASGPYEHGKDQMNAAGEHQQ